MHRDFYNVTNKPGNDGSVSCNTYCTNPNNYWPPSYSECQYSYDVNGKRYHTCEWEGRNSGVGNVVCGCTNMDKTTGVDFNFAKLNTDTTKGSVVDIITGPMATTAGSTYYLGPYPDTDNSYLNGIWEAPETTIENVGFRAAVNSWGGGVSSNRGWDPNCYAGNNGFDPSLTKL